MFAFFGLGPTEMIILLAIGVMTLVPLIVVFVVLPRALKWNQHDPDRLATLQRQVDQLHAEVDRLKQKPE